MKTRRRLVLVLVTALGLPAVTQEIPRIELGVQYTGLGIPSGRDGCLGCNAINHGFGGRFVANFNRIMSFDCEFDFFPDPGQGATNTLGGRVMAGFFGLKGGYRVRRFGIFAKARPGFQSYGHAITSVATSNPPQFNFGRRVNFALDFGAVVEHYASRRIALRFDYGIARIRFNTGYGHVWGNQLHFGTGMLFRF